MILIAETLSRSWAQKQEIPPPIPPPTRIAELRVYPIKSCRGFTVQKTKLLRTGLELDRKWMFVDAATNKFLTIREESKMTLINTHVDEEKGELVVDATSTHSDAKFTIPTHPSTKWLDANTKLETVTIWGKTTDGYVYGAELTAAFKDMFGKEVRLVMKGPTPRPLGSNGAPKYLGRTEKVNFPDLAPILVASLTSVTELNSRLTEQGHDNITIERFRPNVIVEGGEPWTEDQWKTVRLGDAASRSLTMDVTQRCARCQVPNVEPSTGEKHKTEPWNTLMSYRRVDWGMKWKPCFGMLCAPRDEGLVEVGMPLEITQTTGLHKYISGFS
jgi:uncharacterized protein YcbX